MTPEEHKAIYARMRRDQLFAQSHAGRLAGAAAGAPYATTWERVNGPEPGNGGDFTYRLAVPGGWLYKVEKYNHRTMGSDNVVTFVPLAKEEEWVESAVESILTEIANG